MIIFTLKVNTERKRVDTVMLAIIATELDSIKDELRHGIREKTVNRESGVIVKWEMKEVEDEESNT